VELARAVAAEHPGVAVLLVSGFVDAATLDLDGLATPCAFLPKPFTREQLIDAVQALLARSSRPLPR
jgi:DNA-binding NarL/FixJ family response regulator